MSDTGVPVYDPDTPPTVKQPSPPESVLSGASKIKLEKSLPSPGKFTGKSIIHESKQAITTLPDNKVMKHLMYLLHEPDDMQSHLCYSLASYGVNTLHDIMSLSREQIDDLNYKIGNKTVHLSTSSKILSTPLYYSMMISIRKDIYYGVMIGYAFLRMNLMIFAYMLDVTSPPNHLPLDLIPQLRISKRVSNEMLHPSLY